jgi:flavorubredoxin
MDTKLDEISDRIYRISTLVPEAAHGGFTFNQFLIDTDEPLLFHTGPRAMFPLVAEAVARVLPPEQLRWIAFGHVESDESGSVNLWLAAAPHAQVAHSALGCEVQLDDLCDRPPLALTEGQVIDLGDRRVRQISTPHVPHGWEAQVLFEEETGTLFCGDILSHAGGGPALTTADVVGPAMEAEEAFGAFSLAPHTSSVLRSLADLEPATLAIMHGSSFRGDCGTALRDLADALVPRLAGAAR